MSNELGLSCLKSYTWDHSHKSEGREIKVFAMLKGNTVLFLIFIQLKGWERLRLNFLKYKFYFVPSAC